MAEGKITTLSTSLVAQLQPGGTSNTSISNVKTNAWFGPSQPMIPVAPPGTGGRLFDYAFGTNLQYVPRSTEPITFESLRALADNLPLLRAVIETRKDQIAGLPFSVRLVPDDDMPAAKRQKANDGQRKRIQEVKQFLKRPDRILPFETWLRALLEDMLVIDAATIYPRPTLDGGVYSLDAIDGATIKPLVDVNGRRPDAPDPAFQQVLKGVVAADFTQDELLYLPRNVRTNKVYGFSPVEQIVMTVNIALRRDTSTLEYYRSGTVPDSFGTLPKEWTADQIKQFQEYFDGLMSGNTQARRGMRFMPSDFKYQESRQPPLKDQYDEWLARLICYVFSVPVTPFVAQVNRATAETQRLQANDEGLVPLQNWIKHFMDHIIQVVIGDTELEFAWSDGATIDPVQQMTELTGYVAAGVYNRDEVRDKLGEGPISDGSGKDYTSAATLNPARLQTPEEKMADQQHAMMLATARKPGDPAEGNQSKDQQKQGDDTKIIAQENQPDGEAEKFAKDAESAATQPRDGHGRFASTGTPKSRASKDTRPRDGNGRFINSGGSSRGYTAAAKRKKLIEGVKNAAERAVVGAVLYGGAALAAAAFAPEAGAAALTIGIVRAVGTAAIGDAATTAVLAVLDYLKVPASLRDSVQSAVHLGLGAYGLAEAKTNFDEYMGSAEKAKAVGETNLSTILDAIQTVLYEVGQDVTEGMKAKVAAKAKKGDGKALETVNEGLEDALEAFLDRVDALGGTPHPDGGDHGSAKDHPVADVSDHPVTKRDVDGEARDDHGRWASISGAMHTAVSATGYADAALTGAVNGAAAGAIVGRHPAAIAAGAAVGTAGMLAYEYARQKFNSSSRKAEKLAKDAPRTLYAGRYLVNADELRAWMTEQGFKNALPAEDMHVTTVYSKTPLLWPEKSNQRQITANANIEDRKIEVFGEGAVVLTFKSTHLEADHARLLDAGAKSDYPDYRPHVTLTYDAGDVDLSKVEPFTGALIFGPEYFEEIKANWHDEIDETATKMAKGGANWSVLEPMWQAPAHEKRSVLAYRKALADALGKARKQIAAHVRKELSKVGKVADPDANIEALAQQVAANIPTEAISDAAGPLGDAAEQAAREVAKGALVRVGLGDDEGMVERVSERAVNIARERSAELVGMKWDESASEYVPNPNADMAITESTRDMIRQIVADGLNENLSADDIAERLETSLAFSPERADLIAKTEIARVNSDAALETYAAAREAGVQIKKKWIVAAKDVCDDCTLNAKQGPIDLDEAFQSGEKAPPEHPHCRCAIAPVVYSADEVDDTEE